MNRWTNRQTDEWMNEQTKRPRDCPKDGQSNGYMKKQTKGWKKQQQANGWIDGWTNISTDAWLNREIDKKTDR